MVKAQTFVQRFEKHQPGSTQDLANLLKKYNNVLVPALAAFCNILSILSILSINKFANEVPIAVPINLKKGHHLKQRYLTSKLALSDFSN